MELEAETGRPEDRLATAIFAAALLHGLVILGVRFAAPDRDERPLPTLEVLLVPDGPAEEDNPDASYLAERDQQGSGTTLERGLTSLPEASASLIENEGEALGEAYSAQDPGATAGGVQLHVTSMTSLYRPAPGEQAPSARSVVPIEARPLPQVGSNASAANETLLLRGAPSDDDRLRADTRESQIAGYLDGWKRRIERVGTLNFPNEARRRSLSGNPVLEVAIRADGTLEQVLVRRSSGHRELDEAAVRIVRVASPFDPFPPAMRDGYPVLRFAYEWQFLKGHLGSGAVLSGNP